MKRLIIGLIFVLGLFLLMPAAAQAADYDVWVGGVQVTDENKGGVTGEGITGTVSYDPESNTLTLENATITGVPDSTWSSGNINGIYYKTNSLTINLVGDNYINVPSKSFFYSAGIKGDEDYNALSIQGSGTLAISVEEVNIGGSGIDTFGTVTIGDDAKVTLTVGSTGIYCGKKEHEGTYPPRTITIEDNSQVTITLTNEGIGNRRGIYCDGNILITGLAKVNVTMHDATTAHYLDIAIKADEKITISGQSVVTAEAGNGAYYSYGIEGAVVEVLDSAQLTAAGGNVDIGFFGSSVGILGSTERSSSFTIADTAQVTATGGTAVNGKSYGIGCLYYYESMDYKIILRGGTLWAQGQTGALIRQPEDGSGTPISVWEGTIYPPVYSIDLDQNGTYTFPAQYTGYGALTPLEITVTNSGNQETGEMSVELSGTDAGSFSLSDSIISSIAVSGTDSFSVVPKTGLAAGTYTATVTVSGANGISESFDVSFTVNSSGGSNGGGSNGSSSGNDTPGIISRTDSSTGISAEGNLSGAFEVKTLVEAGRGVANEVVDPATYNELKLTVDDGYTVIGAYEVRLTSFISYLTLTFPVGDEHNGKSYVVKHRTGTGKIISYKGIVEKGRITIRVTELSPFMIAILEAQFTPETKIKNPFSDVRESDWFYNTVLLNFKKGLLKGTSASTFSPNAPMTRGMFATVLARIDGADLSGYTTTSFNDVEMSKYYGPSVAWAAEKGIIVGYGNGLFGAEDSITREQMAAMLANYIKVRNIKLYAVKLETVQYADDSQINPWAKDSVYQMQIHGLMGGRPGNIYDPKSIATRAEVAQVLLNYENGIK
ncbi:MAG: S-layer homology domain-containing protein [Clostridia bacterium]|nr:S-layer homology domain-containing protein [Clostridia bacterium]